MSRFGVLDAEAGDGVSETSANAMIAATAAASAIVRVIGLDLRLRTVLKEDKANLWSARCNALGFRPQTSADRPRRGARAAAHGIGAGQGNRPLIGGHHARWALITHTALHASFCLPNREKSRLSSQLYCL
jgi:hypothetical protein